MAIGGRPISLFFWNLVPAMNQACSAQFLGLLCNDFFAAYSIGADVIVKQTYACRTTATLKNVTTASFRSK